MADILEVLQKGEDMNRIVRVFGVIALSISFMAVGACGTDDNCPTAPDGTNSLVVNGVITEIQNDIAVDGGITLEVDLVNGGSDRLIFGSLFTSPPPTEEHLKLYDVVRRVEIGDIVRAEGARADHGLVLEKLWIVGGRP
jgi:hypothetical protein